MISRLRGAFLSLRLNGAGFGLNCLHAAAALLHRTNVFPKFGAFFALGFALRVKLC
jgi:hypothetical protein